MIIHVTAKNNYGKTSFYPVSDDAILLAKIIGKPSLSKRQLEICLEAGWEVEIVEKRVSFKEYINNKKS